MATAFRQYLAEMSGVAVAPFWLDVSAKATVLLLAAIAATALLRRSSAALRHRIWCTAFAALVSLPVLSAALPEWRLAVLPRVISPAGRDEYGTPPPQAQMSSAPARQEVAGPPARQTAIPLAEQAVYEAPLRGETAAVETAAAHRPLNLGELWLVGALVALGPLVAGLARTRLLRRQAMPMDDAVWTSLLQEMRQRLALARRVGLYETDSALMPMTWGLWRPVVMLPRHAREWTGRLRRFVLLHELAHVKRCDVGFQILGRLACALYWFHPLAWYALRRLRIERELACDDCVVLAGERATDYASELLHIARSYRPAPFAAAVAMAQRSNLEHRLRAMFDRACSHLPLSPRAARLLLAGVMLLATVIAAVRLAPRANAENYQPDDAAKETGAARSEAAKSSAESADVIVVRGRVLDPDDKPFAGATVYALGWYWVPEAKRAPLGESKSKADGRFELSYPNPKTTEAARLGQMSATQQTVAAVADGFGPGFVSTDASLGKELILRLVRDDVPVAGRVLDLEGRPVAGVRVSVIEVKSSKGDDLSAWLEAIKLGELNWAAARHLEAMLPEYEAPRAAPVITDAAGRYRVTGIGRERVGRLLFEGPAIAYTKVEVVTRRVAPMQMLTRAFDKLTRPVYGADLDLTVSPTQPIVGAVRDADSGKPLAGVTVANYNWLPGVEGSRLLRTVTDDSGRYRLAGLPKMSGIELLAIPNDEQPFFMQEAAVPDSPTLDPVTVNFDLHRGIWITGRITDKATGGPAAARVRYFPFLTNEYARQRAPEFVTKGYQVHGSTFGERYTTRPDGTYRLVGLPGRAIVGAECPSRPYRYGVGVETIADGPDQFGHFPTYHNNLPPSRKWPNSIKEIDPPADAKSVTCDIELDPGESIHVAVVDPDERPLVGYKLDGDMPMQRSSDARQESTFDVLNLGPEEARIVLISHQQRRLGRVVKLRLEEQPKRSLTVKLEPCATVKARLFNTDGDPIPGVTVTAWTLPNVDFSPRLSPVTTDHGGRFEYEDVPTGCAYDLGAEAAGMFAWVIRNLQLAPGETKDLGDVTFGDKPETAEKSAALPEDTTKPAASEGRTGRANDNAIIRGRVLDLEGRPVRGAEVHVEAVRVPAAADGGSFDKWLAAAQDSIDAREFSMSHNERVNRLVPAADTAKGALMRPYRRITDDEGRVELYPGGAERVLDVIIDGDGLASTHCLITTRLGAPIHLPGHAPGTESVHSNPDDDVIVYGAMFEHVAAPGCRIEGVVRDQTTGEPLARVTVRAERRNALDAFPSGLFSSITDAEGRYRVEGVPTRAKPTPIVVVPRADRPYLTATGQADLEHPRDDLQLDFALARGVWVEGRVSDKETGKGARADVSYFVWGDNPHLQNRSGRLSGDAFQSRTLKDDTYRILAFPGRGVIAVRASSQDYAWGIGAAGVDGPKFSNVGFSTEPIPLRPDEFNSMASFEAAEGAETVRCDVFLEHGVQRTGGVVDTDGNPLEGAVWIRGRKAHEGEGAPLDGSKFTVESLAPGETRMLLFEHQARRLIGMAHDGPLVVELKPWATLAGRVVGEDGEPRSDVHVLASQPAEVKAKVGKDGRFELDHLVPGAKYRFGALFGSLITNWLASDVVFEPGETRDLGDVVAKSPK